MDASVAYLTFPDNENAALFARGLISQKIATCVNLLPQVSSFFLWKKELSEESEHILIVKLPSKKRPDLEKYIKEYHPYETPAFFYFSLDDGGKEFLEWVSQKF